MASASKKRSKRPATRPQPSAGGPRRLGNQQPPPRSASAQRRYQRSHRGRSSAWTGWAAVGVVVIAVAVIVAVKLSGGNTPAAGASSGDNPSAMPAAVTSSIEHIPAATFNAVGIDTEGSPLVVTKKQPALREDGKLRFVYVGAEYCPYCAVMRWAMVAALSRFGTFTGLKQTSSSADVAPIPTFSFLGAHYTSPYLVFTPYEIADRNGNNLMAEPADVSKIYDKYDGSGSTPAAPFNATQSPGYPFIDIGNKFVSAGTPAFLNDSVTELAGGGPGIIAIAQAIANPKTPVGISIGATGFDVQANYLSAAICKSDGGRPGSVCDSPGVRAAMSNIDKVKPVD